MTQTGLPSALHGCLKKGAEDYCASIDAFATTLLWSQALPGTWNTEDSLVCI